MVCNTDQHGGILLPIPLGEERVFRNQAMDDLTELLYNNPHMEFGVRQIRDVTGHGAATVDTAISLLDQVGLITTRRKGNKKLIGINQDRIQKPDDPLLEIPQKQFRRPVTVFLDRVKEALDENLIGVILFGSVARGEADRASDIDIQVIVADNLTQARRELHVIRQEIENRQFEGDRYEIQLLTESDDTARGYGGKLQEIFSEGITLYQTEALDELKEVIYDG